MGVLKNTAAIVLGPIARALTAAHGRILMYHRFGEPGQPRRMDYETFACQLTILRQDFRVRRLSEVVARLQAGEPLEPRTAVVTVDDGYADFNEYAVPVLEKHEVPATIYLVTRFVAQEIWLWFDAVHWLAQHAGKGSYTVTLGGEAHPITLRSPADRHALWLKVNHHCVTLSPDAQADVLKRLQSDLGLALPQSPTAEYSAMSWDQARALNPALIEVGAHTCNHPLLSRCSTDLQREEIAGSKKEIEARLGRPVEAFCYPNGMPDDCTDTTVRLVREAGFSNAVLAHGGMSTASSDRYRLERLGAPDDALLFRNSMNGLWHLRDSLRR